MNYIKIAQAFFENRNGRTTIPRPLAWALKHYKLVIGIVIGGFVLFVLLVFGVLIAALIFFARGATGAVQVPNTENLIQSGREYLDQQFGLENQKLDQLQQEVQDVKEVLQASPQPAGE